MDKLLKNELEQKIKERDELLENGADREDIINANIRIQEIRNQIAEEEIREREKQNEAPKQTGYLNGESRKDKIKKRKGKKEMAGTKKATAKKTVKKAVKKVAKKPAKKTGKK